MTEFDPRRDDFEQAVRSMFDGVPYRKIAKIELDQVKPGYVLGHMDRSSGLTQQNGYFHAGALTGLADSVGGLAAYSLMAEGENVLSVNLSVSLIRPADYDRIWAEGKVVKAGKSIYVCEARIYSDRDLSRLLVSTTITLMAVQG